MNIKDIADVIENFYYIGRIKSDKTLDKRDFGALAKFALGTIMRDYWYNPLIGEEGDRYSFVSGFILPKIYSLGEPDKFKRRRIDMSNTPVIRLPMNAHILYVLPVSGECTQDIDELSQVQPGEELFYTSSEFDFFKYFVSKGEGLDAYNIPECVKEVEVQAVFDNDEADVPYDFAFQVCNQVLGVSLKVKGFPVDTTDDGSPNFQNLQERLIQKDLIK